MSMEGRRRTVCTKIQLHCVSKRILSIINCKLNENYQIVIISGTNIPETTGHHMTIQVPSGSVYI